MNSRRLSELFISFFKIGLVAFGGGYAVLSMLQREVVEHRQWMTKDELLDCMAISQSLPGIISVNASTMVGYKMAGFWGALTATAASLLPTFSITLIVTVYFWQYTASPLVAKALKGVLLGVTSLIAYAIMKSWRTSIRNVMDGLVAIVASIMLILFKTSGIWVIIGAAIVGFTYRAIASKTGRVD